MDRQAKVSVLGSINADLVARVVELPRPGETVIGHVLSRYSGGKGANQAVAAARLSAQVAFYGMTGADEAGQSLLAALGAEGIETGRDKRL
ncbi:MAG: PfkB family carbohydrate kinase, partial [Candidatus Bipolaricaulis sp.]|nr:PfkB family carbohydrate kinase [Candidatus Bipolaricaulis sp.]